MLSRKALLKDRLEKINKLEGRLKRELGNKKFESITEDISSILKQNNLDITPGISEDLFEYISLLLFKI